MSRGGDVAERNTKVYTNLYNKNVQEHQTTPKK